MMPAADGAAERREVTRCPACGCERFRTAYHRNGYRLTRCRRCGLLLVNPQPSPSKTNAIYGEAYFAPRKPIGLHVDAPMQRFRLLAGQQRLAEVAESHRPPGRLLDVGCGEGFFLDVAGRAGWDCSGVELSEFAADQARRKDLGTIVQGTLRDAAFPSAFFDVVTMFDVIEHLHDPIAELAEVHRVLRPGGLCLMLTPNVASVPARLMGRYWFEIKPPEHLYYYSMSNAASLLRRAGFGRASVRGAGKVLTLEYIALVLRETAPWLSALVRTSAGWVAPLYRRPINFQFGFLLARTIKPWD
jgi:2-polyprenyl-3-methyl-5-hydroxy-6-metoxy-1,4-benzoquinol methylase